MHRNTRVWLWLQRVWGWGTLLKEHKGKLKLFLHSLPFPYPLLSSEPPTIPLCSALQAPCLQSWSAHFSLSCSARWRAWVWKLLVRLSWHCCCRCSRRSPKQDSLGAAECVLSIISLSMENQSFESGKRRKDSPSTLGRGGWLSILRWPRCHKPIIY